MQRALLLVAAALAGALASPPQQVVLTGRGSFGEIHFDHAAHLRREIHCVACHGPGPVRKPEFTPATAHATCRACHVSLRRGPTACRDCHVNVKDRELPGAEPAAATTTVAAASAPAPPATPTTSLATISARLDAAPRPDATLRRTLLAGFTAIAGGARAGAGYTVGAGFEQGRWSAGLELDWTSTTSAERTLALASGGVALPVGARVRGRAALLCGFDTGTPAYLLPVVGARAGLELHGQGGSGAVPAVDASVAWLSALGTRTAPDGTPEQESAVIGALLLRWALPAP